MKETITWTKAKAIYSEWDQVTKPLLKRLIELDLDIPIVSDETTNETNRKRGEKE